VNAKEQLELAIDGPYTREASLALDAEVAADDAKKERARRRRANAIAMRFVSCLNRRDAIRLELEHRTVEPERQRQLEARLDRLRGEQNDFEDDFEEQLTRLATLDA